MFRISIVPGEFGGLLCSLSDGKTEGTARASNAPEALADLIGAVDNASQGGTGECFWPREAGAYRWLIRRNGGTAQVVVLWSAGTLTGWENAFWSECDWQAVESAIREQTAKYTAAHAEADFAGG